MLPGTHDRLKKKPTLTTMAPSLSLGQQLATFVDNYVALNPDITKQIDLFAGE